MGAAPAVVRRARIEDLDALVVLWREMWDHHVPLDPRFRTTPAANLVMQRWIEGHLLGERSAVFVAEEADGSLSGYVLGLVLENPPVVPWTHYGHVSELAVRGADRRRGLGGRLLGAIHGWFRERGLAYAEANVSVLNPGARAFWRKQGYGEFIERLRVEL
jgi:ribosomal protein S18 acetylase RimI-like enzyme